MVGTRMRRIAQVAGRAVWADDAQDLIEYALLSALLAVACIGGILRLSRLVEFFNELGARLAAAL